MEKNIPTYASTLWDELGGEESGVLAAHVDGIATDLIRRNQKEFP